MVSIKRSDTFAIKIFPYHIEPIYLFFIVPFDLAISQIENFANSTLQLTEFSTQQLIF
jgi:hypothetical protein